MSEPEALLRSLFRAAVEAADPAHLIEHHLPSRPRGRTIVVGAGKGSAAMAQAFERAWPWPLEGLVVTRYGHAVPCERIEIVEAAHPVPDAAGQRAAERILERVQGLGPDDLVVALISGGGSALLVLPGPGLTLEDKQTVNRALLRSGAGIEEMNCVRKHLSGIKGGRLAAAAAPARVVSLLISDIPGDDPAAIASGPTLADATSAAEALTIVERYRLEVPDRVRRHLSTEAAETPKPGDPRFARNELILIATPQLSLEAAARLAREHGLTPVILGDAIEGEAREVARVMGGIAMQVRRHGQPIQPPCVLLSGGETTVTVRGNGRGGRNVEFLLGLAVALQGAPGIWAVAGDTDGIDGAEEIAGAIVRPDTLARGADLGLNARRMLDDNDAHAYFERLGDQVITGPTLTNVNDFRAILVDRAS